MTSGDHPIEIVKDTIFSAEFCFLITQSESGKVSARLMQPFRPEEDLTIWLGTSPRSRKVREIKADARVTLAYELPQKGAYVILHGRAYIEDYPSKRRLYWRKSFTAFWSAGPEGNDYVLIRFAPSRIEIMHMEEGVAPEPVGLRPAIVVKERESWAVAD